MTPLNEICVCNNLICKAHTNDSSSLSLQTTPDCMLVFSGLSPSSADESLWPEITLSRQFAVTCYNEGTECHSDLFLVHCDFPLLLNQLEIKQVNSTWTLCTWSEPPLPQVKGCNTPVTNTGHQSDASYQYGLPTLVSWQIPIKSSSGSQIHYHGFTGLRKALYLLLLLYYKGHDWEIAKWKRYSGQVVEHPCPLQQSPSFWPGLGLLGDQLPASTHLMSR